MALPCRAECPSQNHSSHEPFLDPRPNLGHHRVPQDTSLPAATSRSSLVLMLGLLITLRLLRFPDVPVVPKNPLHHRGALCTDKLMEVGAKELWAPEACGALPEHNSYSSLIPKAGQSHGRSLSPGKRQTRAPWRGSCPPATSLGLSHSRVTLAQLSHTGCRRRIQTMLVMLDTSMDEGVKSAPTIM